MEFWVGFVLGWFTMLLVFVLWAAHPSHSVDAGYGHEFSCGKHRVIVHDQGFSNDYRALRGCKIVKN